MDPDVHEQVEAMQPRKGALLLLIPAAMVGLTFVLYAGMLALGLYGRPADGDRVVMAFTGCAAAAPVVQARVAFMGLGDPVLAERPDGFDLQVTLPADPHVARGIPDTLTAPGRLQAVRRDAPDQVLFTEAEVAHAAIRQDLTLIPWTVLTLTDAGVAALGAYVREDREGRVIYRMDGAEIGSVSNLKGATPEVELSPELEDDRARLEAAAARAVVLDSGPLPCPLSVVTAVAPPPPG